MTEFAAQTVFTVEDAIGIAEKYGRNELTRVIDFRVDWLKDAGIVNTITYGQPAWTKTEVVFAEELKLMRKAEEILFDRDFEAHLTAMEG